MAEGETQLSEFGTAEGDFYIKAGGIRYLKVSRTGVLSAVNGGRLDANILMFPNGPIHGWATAPFNAADYTGATVEAGDVVTNLYARIGGVLNWLLVVTGITTPGSPNSPAIRVSLPTGATLLNDVGGGYSVAIGTTRSPGTWIGIAGTSEIQLFAPNTPSWPSGTNNVEIRGQFILPVTPVTGAGPSGSAW